MKKGFTLIELLVVITIIGILAAGATAIYSGAQAKARDAVRQNDVQMIGTAINFYGADNSGSYAVTAKSDIAKYLDTSPTPPTTIKNKYDKAKSSRVIEFSGGGVKSSYILAINESKNKKLLHWQMKYTEDFVIFISLETKLGKRYLLYTSGRNDGYMQYGLGTRSISGTWQRFSRNLEDDLRYFDNRNSIVKVKSFVIRGSGSLDNIKMMKELKHKAKESVEKVSKEIENKPLKIKKKLLPIKKKTLKIVKKTNITPVISLEGENPLFLEVGEAFEEPGVSAKDKESTDIIVTSSENIDKYKEGKYAVIYMATDRLGNASVDKRYVIVGNPTTDESEESNEGTDVESGTKSEKMAPPEGEESDAQYKLEERELEIAEWERELQFREKEIAKREENMIK